MRSLDTQQFRVQAVVNLIGQYHTIDYRIAVFFSLVKYFVSQILAGSNFRHRATPLNFLNRQKEFFEI